MDCTGCGQTVKAGDAINGFCPKCVTKFMAQEEFQSRSRANRPVPNVKVVFVNQGVTGRGMGNDFARMMSEVEDMPH